MHNSKKLHTRLLPLAAILAVVSITGSAGTVTTSQRRRHQYSDTLSSPTDTVTTSQRRRHQYSDTLSSPADTVTTSQFRKITSEERIYKQKKVIDISHKYIPDLTVYDSKNGLGHFIRLVMRIKLGDLFNLSEFKLTSHSGTHVDAPGHFNETLFELGYDANSLDLRTLNGPVLVVDTPRDKNITAEVLRSLNIPRGVKRVLFRTLNTDRRLMHKKEYDSSYTAFTSDGAEYLVQNTDIKLVGVDYLSVAISPSDHLLKVHQLLLSPKDIIPVEGLNLDDAFPGVYTIHCLPLRLVHADGSPARCIIFQ